MEMSFLREEEEKSNREKQTSSSTLLGQKTIYFKVLLQKVFEITTESNPASLTAMVDRAADLTARNFSQSEEFHATPRSKLPDYLWS